MQDTHHTRALQVAGTGDLQSKLESLFDYLYANAPVRTPIGIWGEVQKILQTGVFVEQTLRIKPAYVFSPSELAKLARFDDPITTALASKVRHDFNSMNVQLPASMQDQSILLRDENIAMVCSTFSGVHLSPLHTDIIGEALEVFRHNWTKRTGGQFFTDPAVTRLAIDLLDFDPRDGHDLVDLAAGTGGFLLAAANRIRNSLIENTTESTATDREFSALVSKSLKGMEIDQSLADVANMTIGARIAHFDFRAVAVGDSLDPTNSKQLAGVGIRDSTHLCAATNPPFGTKISVRNHSILANYETAYIRNQRLLPSPTSLDILFLERNLQILKPGLGRLAIVLPYQLTSGPQARPVREWLLKHAVLETVVDLPPETFQPYTGTKTCLVLLRRRLDPLQDLSSVRAGSVFMSVPKWIGHDRRGKPVYETAPDGRQTTKILSDIDAVSHAYHTYSIGDNPTRIHSGSFAIDAQEVFRDPQLRFNARFYQPNRLLSTIAKVTKSRHWRTATLGSVSHKIFFPGRFKRRYVEESDDAVPFLGGTNISQHVPVIEKWLSNKDPLVEKLQVLPGWLLITRSGSTGIVSLVPDHWAGWAVSEHVIRIVPNKEVVDPAYLEAYLRTKFAKASIQRGVFGSVIDEITPDFVSEMEIVIPESRELREKITGEAQRARQARNESIARIVNAVDILEKELTRTAL